jgi:glyoxylase I family protein
MKNIQGIGGLIFRTKDPVALKKWYVEVLGINIQDQVWYQEAGPTVFQPFKLNTDYFENDKQWMINFRVADLKGLMEDLRRKGIEVITKDEWDAMPEEVGTFARIYDPEGNPIELWEPGEK